MDDFSFAAKRRAAAAMQNLSSGHNLLGDPRVSAALGAGELSADQAFLRALDLLAALRQRKLIGSHTQPLSSGDISARAPLVQLVNRFDTHLRLNAAPLVVSARQGRALRFHLGQSSFPLPVFIALRYHLYRLGYRDVCYQFQNGCDRLIDPFRQVPWASGFADVNAQQ